MFVDQKQLEQAHRQNGKKNERLMDRQESATLDPQTLSETGSAPTEADAKASHRPAGRSPQAGSAR